MRCWKPEFRLLQQFRRRERPRNSAHISARRQRARCPALTTLAVRIVRPLGRALRVVPSRFHRQCTRKSTLREPRPRGSQVQCRLRLSARARMRAQLPIRALRTAHVRSVLESLGLQARHWLHLPNFRRRPRQAASRAAWTKPPSVRRQGSILRSHGTTLTLDEINCEGPAFDPWATSCTLVDDNGMPVTEQEYAGEVTLAIEVH